MTTFDKFNFAMGCGVVVGYGFVNAGRLIVGIEAH